MNPTRRRFLAGLSVLAVAPVLAACGSDSGSDSGSAGASRPRAALREEAAFPVTIKHKYGETTIEKAPERVVCIGLTDQDALMALGDRAGRRDLLVRRREAPGRLPLGAGVPR